MSSPTVKTVEKKAAVKNGISRMVFAVLAILLEVILILLLFTDLSRHAEWINLLTRFIAIILVLVIYAQKRTSSMKMPWIMLIMAFPLLGVALYMLIGLNGSTWKMRRRYEEIDAKLLPMLPANADVQESLFREDRGVANIAAYLKKYAGYPAYRNTKVTYFDDAAKGLEAQLTALSAAKRFIFMEYHAIEDAESWARIQSVLERKVREGVEVRVFYDDMGSIGFINTDFVKRLESVGIACRVFNPFAPGLNLFLNNRDHRKITVVDGTTGFTGGYNLANEYFNVTHPYGEWKDTGIRLEGEAVRSLTMTFLEMWNAVKETDNAEDDTSFGKYLPKITSDKKGKNVSGHTAAGESAAEDAQAGGAVIPYADSPMDNIHVGEDVYISIIENAKDYVWFMTPYLIITDEMIHAMTLAARRGVDVRVITPGIPDKKIIYGVTRSYYNPLAEYGVRIYEWTPGFCHAKMCVSDDKVSTCGTINLDYRSLYHHFENGCLLYNCSAVLDTREDFSRTFAQCREVTEQYASGRGALLRLGQLVLRLFAALM